MKQPELQAALPSCLGINYHNWMMDSLFIHSLGHQIDVLAFLYKNDTYDIKIL
ncbi:hypothetical protein ACJX0J_009126, partial [Zea mays]